MRGVVVGVGFLLVGCAAPTVLVDSRQEAGLKASHVGRLLGLLLALMLVGCATRPSVSLTSQQELGRAPAARRRRAQ
jgi:uncharacterized protein YcfL